MRQPIRSGTTIIIALLIACLSGPATAGDTLFQYSTIDALLAGLYDGRITVQDLKYQGDFGLGTLNGLDGELIVLEGQAYHVTAGGTARIPADSSRIPFAAVSFFEQDTILKLDALKSLAELNRAVSLGLATPNVYFAIRIDARFAYVKARAIPRQNPPYIPLAEAAKQQQVVQFTGNGTLVGFYSPPYAKGVGVPGFHWHFITEDRTGGGHVLDLSMDSTVARIDRMNQFTVRLPRDKTFDALDLTHDKGKELHAVETDPAKKD